MNTPKIGFCCKYQTYDKDEHKEMNQGSTTLKALRAITKTQAADKLLGIVTHNVDVLWRQLNWIAKQPEAMRLFRITSDFLPAYTVEEFSYVYADPTMRKVVEDGLGPVAVFCDDRDIRLCTHPGQFTTLCSQRDDVVANSVVDLNYHAYLAESMGFGATWHSQGFAINIHANNNLDPGLTRLKAKIPQLSPTLRNLLTIENDEFGCSVDEMIAAKLYDHVALILDIHHHWVESAGEYIEPADPRIDFFKTSWRGSRPLGHFSTSSEQLLVNHNTGVRPDYPALFASGHKPSKLRAHSFTAWNQESNDWALRHLQWTDLEVEAKGKQLASRTLYEQALANNLV